MKRISTQVGVLAVMLCLSGLVIAKEKKPKPGPLSGTWDCISHGSSRGDMPFTLHLEQTKENIAGSVESPMGGTDITSGSFKKKKLEILIHAGDTNYHVIGKLKKKQLAGEWLVDNGEKGTWEGKKAQPTK